MPSYCSGLKTWLPAQKLTTCQPNKAALPTENKSIRSKAILSHSRLPLYSSRGWLHYPPVWRRNVSSTTAWRATSMEVPHSIQNSLFPSLTDLVQNGVQLPYSSPHISRSKTGFCSKQIHGIPWLYREVWRWKTWTFLLAFFCELEKITWMSPWW